ncbi:unnamed protein product [Cuscuta epithymum]|uniref:Major facilitator superfamily (MFS) profile domain-containing protein n=1 Tax=Cuscuta epithymum TaxID=186058 RepID=A0AAV0DZ87_9ASTE|nr:unnamed protein product [Cuscuta epithymum]
MPLRDLPVQLRNFIIYIIVLVRLITQRSFRSFQGEPLPQTRVTSRPSIPSMLGMTNLSQYRTAIINDRWVIANIISSMIGGLLYGYSLSFVGGLITMKTFVHAISPEWFEASEKAKTTNFCPYIDTPMALLSVIIPFSLMLGVVVATTVHRTWRPQVLIVLGLIIILCGVSMVWALPKTVGAIIALCLIGFGNGMIREVIPIYYIQKGPEHFSTLIENTYNFANALGPPASLVVYYCILRYSSDKKWIVAFKVIGVFALLLFVFVLISLKSVQEREIIESDRPFRDIVGRYKRTSIFVVSYGLIPQLIGFAPLAFYAPLVFESLGLRDREPILASMVAAFCVFGFTILVTFLLIPFLGRRKVLICSCLVMSAQAALSKLLHSQKRHPDKPGNVVAIVIMLVTCAGYAGFSGFHGWTRHGAPKQIDRVMRATTNVMSLKLMVSLAAIAPFIICAFAKSTFIIGCVVCILYIVVVYVFVYD